MEQTTSCPGGAKCSHQMGPGRAGEITPLLIFMGVVFFIAAVFQRLLVSRVLRDWRAATLSRHATDARNSGFHSDPIGLVTSPPPELLRCPTAVLILPDSSFPMLFLSCSFHPRGAVGFGEWHRLGCEWPIGLGKNQTWNPLPRVHLIGAVPSCQGVVSPIGTVDSPGFC